MRLLEAVLLELAAATRTQGGQVRTLRQLRGLSARDLAGRARVDEKTIVRLEKDIPVRDEVAARVFAVLGVEHSPPVAYRTHSGAEFLVPVPPRGLAPTVLFRADTEGARLRAKAALAEEARRPPRKLRPGFTKQDLALAAGVAWSTAARYLAGKPVRRAMRARIERAVADSEAPEAFGSPLPASSPRAAFRPG